MKIIKLEVLEQLTLNLEIKKKKPSSKRRLFQPKS